MLRLKEAQVHARLCNYVRENYPGVHFNSDLSGVKLPPRRAAQVAALRSGTGWPDFQLYARRGPYCGLAIEIKATAEDLYLADGQTRRRTEHLDEQAAMLEYLRGCGWRAEFGVGLVGCIALIDEYLGEEIE